MNEKVTVVVPAYNEEENIASVIKSLKEAKRAGIIQNFVIVDDGSTDRTAEIAREEKARLIRLKRNRGKGYAFYAGARYAKITRSTIVVELDADNINLKPKSIELLLMPLKKNPKLKMAVGVQNEGGIQSGFFASGQRALRMNAIEPLFKGGPKWTKLVKNAGLAMDTGLNYLIEGKLHLEEHSLKNTVICRGISAPWLFTTKKAYRTPKSKGQGWQVAEVYAYLRSRREEAAELRNVRRNRTKRRKR